MQVGDDERAALRQEERAGGIDRDRDAGDLRLDLSHAARLLLRLEGAVLRGFRCAL